MRDAAILAIVEIYRHVGEKVRIDLTKRGIPPGRWVSCFHFIILSHSVTGFCQNLKLTKNLVMLLMFLTFFWYCLSCLEEAYVYSSMQSNIHQLKYPGFKRSWELVNSRKMFQNYANICCMLWGVTVNTGEIIGKYLNVCILFLILELVFSLNV